MVSPQQRSPDSAAPSQLPWLEEREREGGREGGREGERERGRGGGCGLNAGEGGTECAPL